MYSINKSPTLNPMARQNVYVSPRLNPIIVSAYMSDSSDDSITLTDKSSGKIFLSNDSLSSFEDFRIQLEFEKKEEKKEEKNISLANCNRGFISSVCCSFCKRN
jgi:hypothetical protein